MWARLKSSTHFPPTNCWNLERRSISSGSSWSLLAARLMFSPRLSGTYVLDNSGDTKISTGIGVIYQSTNLALIAASLGGSRQDTFYNTQGVPATFLTTFTVDRSELLAPRFVNWSVGLERK